MTLESSGRRGPWRPRSTRARLWPARRLRAELSCFHDLLNCRSVSTAKPQLSCLLAIALAIAWPHFGHASSVPADRRADSGRTSTLDPPRSGRVEVNYGHRGSRPPLPACARDGYVAGGGRPHTE